MREVNRRRFLRGVGVATLAGAAGCTGSNGGGGSGGGADTNGSGSGGGDNGSASGGGGSDNGSAEGNAIDSPVTIEFWHAMGGETKTLIENMAKDFNKQSDNVTVKPSKKGSYRETFNATINAAQSGSPPAITQVFEIGTQLAIDSGLFVAMEDFIPSDRVNWDNFLPAVTGYYKSDGKLNSMPFNSSNAIMYLNRDAFEKAGLDPDDPPKTYDDLTTTAKKLKQDGGTPKGTTWANHSWYVEQWFAEQNQPLVNKKNGREGRPTKAFLTSDAAKKTFEWWANLANNGLYLNPGVEAWDAAQQAFSSQKAGIMLESTASIVTLTAGAKQNGFEVSTAELPVPKGQRHGVIIGGASLWVAKGMDNNKQKAAQEFLLWLTQPEQQVRWHKGTGYFPVRKEAEGKLKNQGWFKKNPNFKVAFDQLNASEDTPAASGAQIGAFQKTRTIIEQGFVSMAQGKKVDSVLQSVNSDIEDALESYNKKV